MDNHLLNTILVVLGGAFVALVVHKSVTTKVECYVTVDGKAYVSSGRLDSVSDGFIGFEDYKTGKRLHLKGSVIEYSCERITR